MYTISGNSTVAVSNTKKQLFPKFAFQAIGSKSTIALLIFLLVFVTKEVVSSLPPG